jgi:hypothetical protein
MAAFGAAHRRRLREVWRGAGWPCHDPIELDLLAAGLLERRWDDAGRETLHVTDAGLEALSTARQRAQASLGAHEALVARVAREMQRAGRLVWCGLPLRAPLTGEDGRSQWVTAIPDVFSIRLTSVEDYVEPIVHEVKVSRADLLADLKRPRKALAYQALSSQCWYALAGGIAQPEEIPPCFGVLQLDQGRLEVVRPAQRRAMRLPFGVWMALAAATALEDAEGDGQLALTDAPETARPGWVAGP